MRRRELAGDRVVPVAHAAASAQGHACDDEYTRSRVDGEGRRSAVMPWRGHRAAVHAGDDCGSSLGMRLERMELALEIAGPCALLRSTATIDKAGNAYEYFDTGSKE